MKTRTVFIPLFLLILLVAVASWMVAPKVEAQGGVAVSTWLSTANTTAAGAKTSAGYLYGYSIQNPNASICVLQVFNGSPATLGTTQEIMDIPIAASAAPATVMFQYGIYFSNGIYLASTTAAHGGSTCGTGMVLNIFYQ